jgi:hypothetical protein
MKPIDIMRQAIINALRAKGETAAAEAVKVLTEEELKAHWPGKPFPTSTERR